MDNFRAVLLAHIFKVPTHAKRSILLKKFYMYYKSYQEFDEVMAQLDSADLLRMEPNGKDIVYIMPDYRREEYTKLLQKK